MANWQRRGRWLIVLGAAGTAAAMPRKTGHKAAGYRNTVVWRIYDQTAQFIDHHWGWDRLPTPLGLLVLVGLRNILRRQNLFDTTAEPSVSAATAPAFNASYLTARTADGSWNDLDNPTMGMANTRFGRNIPIAETTPDRPVAFMEPNPRTISRELMTRHEFIPATSVNVLAATWIQFMVKDWFSHGQGDPAHLWEVPVDPDDPWFQHPMTILKTLPDTTRPADSVYPPTFLNVETPWWDASQIYGTTPEALARRRSGHDGKLVIGTDGLLILPQEPQINPALIPGWWLGLNMMETVFIREHNAICDRLKAAYPTWSDEDLFLRARLIVAALTAKIHTAEWTPAIINHPTTVAALKANWWGVATEPVRKSFGRISKSEVISGIPGSETDHYGVPYSLTEEFSIVYRMHPLTPDLYSFRSAADDSVLAEKNFREIAGTHAQEVTTQIPMSDIFYSFGTAYPGAIVLNNFPRFLQEFQRPDHEDQFMDLAATDILRAREFGVPRYNQFRRFLHLKAPATFEELTGNPEQADALRRVYGDIERVDLTVGMFAEQRPKGFAFSDTAFRIFILMASRRLNSDRFLSRDFRPEVYTPEGYDWVQNNTMLTVLQRHYPELFPATRTVANAFQPWAKATRP
jgi:hypothetical protein